MKMLSPALVVASVALFLTLGGAGYASKEASTKTKVISATATVKPGAKGAATAKCPAGMHASGGGYKTANVGANDSFPIVRRGVAIGWTLTTKTNKPPKVGPATPGTATVYAVCIA